MTDNSDKKAPLVISVPAAGEALGIGRNTAYAAARSGQLPTITLGGRQFVPVAQLNRLLSGEK
jgi:hypothetical protein